MTGAKRKNLRQPPWEGPDSEGISFGTWLRQQREVRQIGLREVAESSKISLRYLQAFEQDRFEELPAPVFAKGFLRQYAAYVGLDPDEVVNHFLWARQALEPEEEEQESRSVAAADRSPWPLLAVVGLVAVVVGLALFSTLGSRRDEGEQTPPREFVPPPPLVPVAPPPSVETEVVAPQPPPPPAAPLVVEVEFVRACWVDALVDNGRQRIAQTYLAGEPLEILAQQTVLFRQLGNSGGVRIVVNGQPYPIDGAEGRVVKNVRIDLATLEALGEAAP